MRATRRINVNVSKVPTSYLCLKTGTRIGYK